MIRIRGAGTCLPPRRVDASEILRLFGPEAARLAERSGVVTRHHAGDMTQVEMGRIAAEDALADAGLSAADLDLVVSASAIPYQAIPGTAAVYASGLGIADGAVATFDVNSTCLSFLTALDLVAAMILTGRASCVLIVSAEIASRGLPWHDDPETAALFGDGAAAVVVTAGTTHIAARLFETHPSSWAACQVAAGGTRHDYHDASVDIASAAYFRMQGKELFRLTAARLPGFMDRLLDLAGWQVNSLNRVLPHQASPLGLRHMQRICGLPEGITVDIAATHGNMIAASIPFVLAREKAAGGLSAGARILLVGTSAGVSFGGMALEVGA